MRSGLLAWMVVSGLVFVLQLACSGGGQASAITSQEVSPATPTSAAAEPRTPAAVATAQAPATLAPSAVPSVTLASATLAPTRQASSPAGVVSYTALLGKTITSAEVSGFLRNNVCSVSGSHYLCYGAGIEVSFDASNRVILVVLNRARGQWKQYEGALPEGVSWNNTRSAVEQKLGAPTASYAGVNGIRAWAQYKAGAVVVTYDVANGAAGPAAPIYDIRVK